MRRYLVIHTQSSPTPHWREALNPPGGTARPWVMSPTEKKYIHKKEQPQAAGVKGGCNVRMHSQRGHHCR